MAVPDPILDDPDARARLDPSGMLRAIDEMPARPVLESVKRR